MRKKLSISVGMITLGALALVAIPTSGVAEDDLPLNMQANAGMQVGGRTSMMDLTVTEWTTPEEREHLIKTLVNDGQEALRQALQDVSTKGRVNRRGQMGINWRYAFQYEKSGGRTIVMASDRPINAEEMISRTITQRDFSITLAIIELDEEDRGAGTLFLGATFAVGADGRLEMTQAGTHGIHLGNVRVR